MLKNGLVPVELFFILLGIFAVAVTLNVILMIIFLQYIKKNHNKTWIELGSFSFILNNSIRNNFLLIKYILLKTYKILNDRKLNKIADALWLDKIFCYIIFAIMLIIT